MGVCVRVCVCVRARSCVCVCSVRNTCFGNLYHVICSKDLRIPFRIRSFCYSKWIGLDFCRGDGAVSTEVGRSIERRTRC